MYKKEEKLGKKHATYKMKTKITDVKLPWDKIITLRVSAEMSTLNSVAKLTGDADGDGISMCWPMPSDNATK